MIVEWFARRNTTEREYERFTIENQNIEDAKREARTLNSQLGWSKYLVREVGR